VFRHRLPEAYWKHFCKLVRIFDILELDSISREEITELRQLSIEYAREFELLYVQRHATRVHFVRPWIHTILHMAREILRIGPPCYYSQWTMERLIGMLEHELRLHSNPYANIAMIATRLAQKNTMLALLPELVLPEVRFSDLDIDFGNGYGIKHPIDARQYKLSLIEANAIAQFREWYNNDGHTFNLDERVTKVVRWAKFAMPNGSEARAEWKERLKPLSHLRISRMVEVCACFLIACHGSLLKKRHSSVIDIQMGKQMRPALVKHCSTAC
jgi:hypothetical protein